MRKISGKNKKIKLKRNKYFIELKIDRQLNAAFRRGNVAMKSSRVNYLAHENSVFCMNSQRCPVAAYFHITSTN